MSVIGIDAAMRKTGYAYVGGPGSTHYWVTGLVDLFDARAVAQVLQAATDAGVTVAAIERPYLGRNPHSYAQLVRASERARMRCEDAGLKVVEVAAQTWQAAFGITGRRRDTKLGAMRVARMLGADPKTQDEADAVCLAEYQRCAGRQSELMLRGPRGGKLRGVGS